MSRHFPPPDGDDDDPAGDDYTRGLQVGCLSGVVASAALTLLLLLGRYLAMKGH